MGQGRGGRAGAGVGVVGLSPFRGPDQSVANPLAIDALAGPLLVARTVAFVVAGLAIPVGAWSLLARCRRAGEVERQQLRWLVVVAVPVALAVAALAAQALTGDEVDQTMQPTQASRWLRQGPSNGLAAAGRENDQNALYPGMVRPLKQDKNGS